VATKIKKGRCKIAAPFLFKIVEALLYFPFLVAVFFAGFFFI
jgi:hypothetical protein